MSTDSPGKQNVFARWLRPKKSRQKLRKHGATESVVSASSTSLFSVQTGYGRPYDEDVPPVPIAPLQTHRLNYKEASSRIDTQLGENRDHTEILHALGLEEPFETGQSGAADDLDRRPPGEPVIASFNPRLWAWIVQELNPKDAACLALASKTLYSRLGRRPFEVLNRPENSEFKIDFLILLDQRLPHHLLCFPCQKYHVRIQEGRERLQAAQILNPLFICPNARNALRPPPRHRITHGRNLPFTFVQLATRAKRFSPMYGIPTDSLSRRWTREEWTSTTRYHIHEGRLLMRVVSQKFAPPGLTPSGKRLLLFSREDYWPFFSVCAHWRDGELMEACKCALGHIPVPRETGGLQGAEAKFKDKMRGRAYDPNAIATLCSFCQVMRRCPKCPTEYLIEIKLAEDRRDPKSIYFRQAIVVTRWSDLGDGTSPTSSPEWAACNGQESEYDSFKMIGKRAISGIFESAFTHDTIPGRRIISMNPQNKKGGHERDDWY
jgi:hypothetical protein